MAEHQLAAASEPGAAAQGSPEGRALHEALAQLLAPVAHLAVARGLPFAAVQEMLKQAFVEAASAAHPGLAPHRKVSRIATATGINRREVTRLTAAAKPAGRGPRAAAQAASRSLPRQPSRTLASELTAHWRTGAEWLDAAGQPRVLPRLGAAPSFEALAQATTRDVHPRSLLDELCRLGLARLDPATDTVALQGDAFVPSGDRVRMLGFLGDNVGDHLRAAVANVLAGGKPPHLEQALFAQGLSAASLDALRPLLREQWSALRQAVVPALEARLAADAAAAAAAGEPGGRAVGGEPLGRVRLGLYAYHETPVPDGNATGDDRPAPARMAGKPMTPAAPRPRRAAAAKTAARGAAKPRTAAKDDKR
ncbi:MAG: hypothetical protein JNL85_06885 [Rubrivivax sp.]|nr:hypothetical protein [Rubrivivax sp.]